MKPNDAAVCKWIHATRKSSRCNRYGKKITIQLFKEKYRQISARLTLKVGKNTGKIVMSHSLGYFGKDIYPETRPNKLRCVNLHAIKQHRKYLDNVNKTIKEKLIGNKICKNMSLITHMAYNINTGHIGVREYFKYKSIYVKTNLKNNR